MDAQRRDTPGTRVLAAGDHFVAPALFETALRDEPAHFRDDAFDGTRTMPPAHLRDDTETARVVAPLGDFCVRGVRRREPHARRVPVGDVNRFARDEVEGLPFVVQEHVGFRVGDW